MTSEFRKDKHDSKIRPVFKIYKDTQCPVTSTVAEAGDSTFLPEHETSDK